jgi:FkbM family methyltransferase
MNVDSKVFDFIKDYIHQGDTAVDIGAHHGKYTDFFLQKVGGGGMVYSYEICPDSFRTLDNKFAHNDNVITNHTAVSDINGTENYYSSKNYRSYGINIMGYDVDHVEGKLLGSIKSTRLDKVLKGKMDFVKIDVEGAEVKVLHGMKGIIENVHYLLIECHIDGQWTELRNLLIYEYRFKCSDILTKLSITELTKKRSYQVFCINDRFIK